MGPNSICVCVTSALIRLLRGDRSTRKIVIRISLSCVVPVIGEIVGIRGRLFVQGRPYVSLSSGRHTRLRCLLSGLQREVRTRSIRRIGLRRRHLALRLVGSVKRAFYCRVLGVCFTGRPVRPLPRGGGSIVFRGFVLTLFHLCEGRHSITCCTEVRRVAPHCFSAVVGRGSKGDTLR